MNGLRWIPNAVKELRIFWAPERVRETLQADGFDYRLTVDTRPEF
jgi:hypothetical protein